MADPIPTPTPAPSGTGAVAEGLRSVSAGDVITGATSKINESADAINALLDTYDPNNPASLLNAQQAMANYNLSITVASSFIKAIQDTAKAVAQHVS